jgi:WD40 repeat protein
VVRALAFSSFGKYICSVGERRALIWAPFNLEVLVHLDGLTASAVSVEVSDEERKLFVALSDKTIRIWHNITFELLQVVEDTNECRPNDVLSAFQYVAPLGALFTAGDIMTM